jgi:hypothetical protein
MTFYSQNCVEAPEFQRQNREFAVAVKAAGKPVKFLIGQSYNHFEMFETLGNLLGKVITVSLETQKLIARLPLLSSNLPGADVVDDFPMAAESPSAYENLK